MRGDVQHRKDDGICTRRNIRGNMQKTKDMWEDVQDRIYQG